MSHTTASCPVPAATVFPSSQAPNQILITRALFPPSFFTRKLVWGHSTITSSTARPGQAARRGVSCKPSHLQTLGHLHHGWRNMPPLATCRPKPLCRTAHMSLFLCKEHHQRSQPFQRTVQYLMMNPAQTGGRLETRLFFPRQLPFPCKSLSQCGGLLPPRWGRLSAPCCFTLPSLTSTACSTFWSQFSLLKKQTQFTFAGLVIFRTSEL